MGYNSEDASPVRLCVPVREIRMVCMFVDTPQSVVSDRRRSGGASSY